MSNHLPVSRIKTIMKSSADVETISKESLHLVTVATEMFIQHLSKRAEEVINKKEIDYEHIAEVVHTSERYDFLTEIIPKKVTVRQFKKMLEEKKAAQSSSESSDTESSRCSDTEENSNEEEATSEHNSSA